MNNISPSLFLLLLREFTHTQQKMVIIMQEKNRYFKKLHLLVVKKTHYNNCVYIYE